MGKPALLSLKNILVILFGGITLLAALPTYWYINHIHAQRLVVDRGEGLRDLANATSSVIAANLHERRREVELLAKSTLFRSGALDSPDLRDVLERTQNSFKQYSWIGLVDIQGTVQSATGGLLLGKSVAARPWFIEGMKGPYAGDLHDALLLSKLLPQPDGAGRLQLIDFAEPVRDAKGQIRGVLGMHVNWSWASQVLKNMQPNNAAQSQVEIMLLNRDNKVIHPSELADSVVLPRELSITRPFLISRWNDGVEYVTSVVPVSDAAPPQSMEWRVMVRQPTAQAFNDLSTIQHILLAAVLLSALLLMGLVWWGATLIADPLEELAEHAREIEYGDRSVQLTAKIHYREMQHLVSALQGMANNLLQRKRELAASNAVLEQAVADRTAELVRTNEELHRISRRDPLTGLFNRLAAGERLHAEFARMKRSQHRYAVLLADIDFFKRVNDTYGHEVGDQVLQSVARVLQAHLRETDFLARFGGEEFLVILPDTHENAAREVAEKLRAAVEAADHATGQTTTLSLGLAMATPDDVHEDDAVRRADQYLYQAKHAGRNRVVSLAES